MAFGTASDPYHLAEMHRINYLLGSSIIKSSFYVHDLLAGVDDLDTLQTKWHSNHAKITLLRLAGTSGHASLQLHTFLTHL